MWRLLSPRITHRRCNHCVIPLAKLLGNRQVSFYPLSALRSYVTAVPTSALSCSTESALTAQQTSPFNVTATITSLLSTSQISTPSNSTLILSHQNPNMPLNIPLACKLQTLYIQPPNLQPPILQAPPLQTPASMLPFPFKAPVSPFAPPAIPPQRSSPPKPAAPKSPRVKTYQFHASTFTAPKAQPAQQTRQPPTSQSKPPAQPVQIQPQVPQQTRPQSQPLRTSISNSNTTSFPPPLPSKSLNPQPSMGGIKSIMDFIQSPPSNTHSFNSSLSQQSGSFSQVPFVAARNQSPQLPPLPHPAEFPQTQLPRQLPQTAPLSMQYFQLPHMPPPPVQSMPPPPSYDDEQNRKRQNFTPPQQGKIK